MNDEPKYSTIAAWLILLGGAALRFYRLADFPFHPDEAIHAWFSLGLGGYHYDPTYHGPLLYHLVAATFGLFGASDWTARLVPALLGVLLLWIVLWPGRKFLETRATLWSGFLLAISPVVAAYSRRLLHDALVLVLTLGAVFCFQVTLQQPSTTASGRWARVGLVALLTLFVATKANAFFIIAMLAAFWLAHRVLHRGANDQGAGFDIATPLLCLATATVLWFGLFRSDAISALPSMIAYWGGQQKAPRLPGPHDYYFVLMLLYELPIVLAALWGAWCAVRRRTAFTDLLLWWASTSIALYAIANEKVPWLLVHQMLPLCLLAGYGLLQVKSIKIPYQAIYGILIVLSGIFLLRHILATDFERAADRHDPLLFAQTTEAYRDTLFGALKSTNGSSGARGIWAAGTEQWPAAWYLREKSPLLEESNVSWATQPPAESTLRVALMSPELWKELKLAGHFQGWNYAKIERYVWPRPAWSALSPQRFARFWWSRQASEGNGVLREDSTGQSIIAWRGVPTEYHNPVPKTRHID